MKTSAYFPRSFGVATMLLTGPAFAADKLFAAPETAGAANTSASGSIGQMTLALALVLAVVFAAAWALKQGRKFASAKGSRGIEVISQVALGAKERAVLLKVGGSHVLVGVAPGHVHALHVCAAPPDEAVAAPNESTTATTIATKRDEPTKAQTFQAILKRSLGLS